MTNYISNLRGEQGGVFVNDTTAMTDGSWACLQVIEDAAIASIVMPGFTDSDDLVGVTLPQGYILYGPITDITLSGGTIQLFNFINPNKRAGIGA